MKVILPAVISIDGRITKGDVGQAHYWSSAEDAVFFSKLIKKHTALVMGRKTYEDVRPKPTPGTLRLVLTSRPEDFAKNRIADTLEFMKARSAQAVIDFLEERGHGSMLLLGGAGIHADFLHAGLVDELYITVEPVLFGAGLSLIEGQLDVRLRLLEMHRLNDQGTLLLHYQIEK